MVVVWHGADDVETLIEAWPEDRRFELLVVDNGNEGALVCPPRVRLLEPGRNLGFAGGVNLGVSEARAPWVLILNADARVDTAALEALLEGIASHPEVAGLVPRMLGLGGEPQFAWQLRSLPQPGELLLHALLLPGSKPIGTEPPEATAVEQPAAAALALRVEALREVGGLDEHFFPAWFEDVDLARRLSELGQELLYWPRAVVRHRLGSTVSRLGYGRFLWIYDRNLVRYLRKHHGALWTAGARLLLPLGLFLRLLLLPLRRPRRAPSRGAAAKGLLGALAGALSGWRRPLSWRRAAEPEES